MMKKILLAVVLCGGLGLTSVSAQQAEERLPGYLQAEKFTKSKLDKCCFLHRGPALVSTGKQFLV